MFGFCNNEREQRQDGQNDFERHGYPDRERYDDSWSDCSKYYTEGYDDARRDEERREECREEERQQEEREHRNQQERMEMQRQEEEHDYDRYLQEQDYLSQQEQQHREQIEPDSMVDDLPF